MQEPVINQCGLSEPQLRVAFRDKSTIKHPARPEETYIIIGFGRMKVSGVWYECCSYMDVKTREAYHREVSDFKKFYLKKR